MRGGDPEEDSVGTSVSAGLVGRPHGLDGSFHVTRPRGRLLILGAQVTVAGRRREVIRRSGTHDRPILRLEGVCDREELAGVRGDDLMVERGALPPLEPEEFWPEDLVGLPVRALDGAPVGEVTGVLGLPSCDVLQVGRPGRGELLVPLVRDAVPDLDPAGDGVRVDLRFLGEDADQPPVNGPE